MCTPAAIEVLLKCTKGSKRRFYSQNQWMNPLLSPNRRRGTLRQRAACFLCYWWRASVMHSTGWWMGVSPKRDPLNLMNKTTDDTWLDFLILRWISNSKCSKIITIRKIYFFQTTQFAIDLSNICQSCVSTFIIFVSAIQNDTFLPFLTAPGRIPAAVSCATEDLWLRD